MYNLKIMFGVDQTAHINGILDKQINDGTANSYTSEPDLEHPDDGMVIYHIEFPFTYGIYLFGRMQSAITFKDMA